MQMCLSINFSAAFPLYCILPFDIVMGQFRIVQQQKNRVEVQGNNLHFPLF